MGIFAIFVPSGDLHPDEDFVGMNVFHRAFFVCAVNVDFIARFQHFAVPLACV
jgi:hypothetical protein